MTDSPLTALTGRARWALGVVFLLSGIGLAYEVALTRLFSLMFQYHYVFLIVSLAVAGLSLGAALAALVLRDPRADGVWGDLVNAAALQAVLLLGVTLVLALLRDSERIAIAVSAALLPFVGLGFLNAALFGRYARGSGVLYAADLLGGAVGLGAVLIALQFLGAFGTIFALSALSGLIALLLAWVGRVRAMQGRAAGLTAVLLIVLIAELLTGLVDFAPRRLKRAPPDKTLLAVLKDPSARITETRWGPFARLDVVETADESVRYVFTDAGAGSVMVGYAGDDRAVAWLRQDIAYLPFVATPEPPGRVLILGAGAGKDILMAHLAGAQAITAVEINPGLVDLTRDMAAYNGGIYDLPSVTTAVTDGRVYVERSDAQYDLIYANLVYSQAAAPGHSALAESYIFTREALRAYWERLGENGRIGFVTHQGIEGLRLLIAALDMLERQGVALPDAVQHVALISLYTDNPQTRTSVVMILRQPWTAESAQAFADEAHRRNAGALHLPFFQEQGLEGLRLGAVTLDRYIADNADEFNFAPTTDDSPFFYQFNPGLPEQIADLLLISVILTGAYLSWSMFFFVRRSQHWKRLSLAPYFAVLGAAFMLVEVPLIQRFHLLLGQPTLALVTVIAALLIGAGLGSLFSSRYALPRLPRVVAIVALAVALAVLLARMALPALVTAALPLPLGGRLAVTALILLPLGFLMGFPFPNGLRVAAYADPEGVPAFWGANAVASVLGSVLAMVLAIQAGFSAALALGAGLYGLAAVLAGLVWPRLVR